jgi:hypothetical protein
VALGSAWDWISDRVDDAGEALNDAWDVVDDLPVFEQLGDGTKALVTGPLRDFAKTGIGESVLRGLTTGLMGTVGWIGGPWLMMASASLPGLARGDSFLEALVAENLWRLEKTAEVLGAGFAEQALGDYQTVIEDLKRKARELFPDLEVPEAAKMLLAQAGVDPAAYAWRLAGELGVREDMAAQALELVTGIKFVSQEDYDLATGRRVPGIARAIAASSPYVRMSTRVATGPTPAERIAKLAAAPVQTRMRTLALRESAPAPVMLERSSGAQAPARPRSGLGSDLALGALVVGAVGAVYLWHRAESRAGR